MSDNIYTTGLGNVGSYQVAGTPYLTGSSLDSEEISFSFPTVTKKIIIENTGSNSVDFYFKESSTNPFTLPNGKKVEIDVKCTQIYMSSSAASGVQLFAELTNIPTGRMYSLDGLEGV
jgi:hypothetical protein